MAHDVVDARHHVILRDGVGKLRVEDGKVRKVYKGLANVEMFPRKSSWESNDNIEYAPSAMTVRYDIMVVDAGKEIALKSAEMRDSDWQALVLSTGKSGESDDNDNEDKDEDETSANSDEPPESGKLSAQVGRSQEGGSQTSIDAFMGRMEKLMEVRNKMTKEAVGWATNPSTDEERKELMPVAHRYTLAETLDACRAYFDRTGRRVTFEYSLVKGKNDSREQAMKLAKLLAGMNCHVNLIPINPVEEREYEKSDQDSIAKFKLTLEKNHINATIRKSMGSDIDAACGQLRRKYAFHHQEDSHAF